MLCNKLFTSRGVWPNGIFIVRIITAVMIFYHGLELFDTKAMDDLKDFLTDIKFPLTVPMAYTAKITEFGGSILLAAGLFTRLITVPLMICMVVVTAGMGNWSIFNSETSSLFFVLFLLFFLTGPGKISADYWLFDRKK
ncbi:MAG TPA: DoxX family protein [Chitinophagaceae bacterium]|nr:DoxX family protein [Chitinophagaceae bacterium]